MRFPSPATSPKPDLEAASDADWEIASRRAHAMEDLLVNGVGPVRVAAVSREHGLSTAMVYRLLARYRANPVPSALLPGISGPPTGSRRLDEEVEAIIQRGIEAYYLKRERPRVVDLHAQIVLDCHRQHLTRPSYKAVWTRVRQIDPAAVTRAREGFKAARDRFASVGTGLRPKKPLDLFQIDHTLADVIIVDEWERRPIGRPWLTLVIDVATRAVAGFHLSLDAPSSLSVALAISHAVLPKQAQLDRLQKDMSWPVEGLPQIIHVDNAKEFHGQALERGCREHKITLKFRPPKTPHFGGHIERLVGTLMGDIHLLPGTTFSSVADRGDYKSEAKAVLTLPELEHWLTLQIVQMYHRRVHRGMGFTPLAAWLAGTTNRDFVLRRPADPQKLYIDFLPGEKRLIRRDGIQLFGIHYWDNTLSPLAGRSKKDILVRYDPRNLSHVFIKEREGGEYMKVPYRDISNPAITLNELRSVSKQMKTDRRRTLDEKSFFSGILEQRAIVEQARKNTAATRRRHAKMNSQISATKRTSQRPVVDSQDKDAPLHVEPYKVEVWE